MSRSTDPQPLMDSVYPRAIAHVDGDAFFTSVEQAIHPALRGKPVVTGKERGIISCASYEAKALGIKRGVSLWEARRICPTLALLPSDYETYCTFSKRMFEIMRRFTPEVEEYSIDEGFADLTGMKSVFKTSYREIVTRMQRTISDELDLTVSIGLSVTKSLAKIASDFRKPNGITPVAGKYIHRFLPQVPLADVWGLGPARVAILEKYGLATAWDYVQRDPAWIKKKMHKPGLEIWHELRGTSVMPLGTEPWRPVGSVSKSKTFSKSSTDRDYIYAKLIRNLESAFIKMRRHDMRAKEITVILILKDYQRCGHTVKLPHSATITHDVIDIVRELFRLIYRSGTEYRSTGVVLSRLEDDRKQQYDLFSDPRCSERSRKIASVVEAINGRYGKHRVFLATGLHLPAGDIHDRDQPCWRKSTLLIGETRRRRIRIPVLDLVV